MLNHQWAVVCPFRYRQVTGAEDSHEEKKGKHHGGHHDHHDHHDRVRCWAVVCRVRVVLG